MEDSQLNGIVQKTQDMEPPSYNRVQDIEEFNSAADGDAINSDARQKKISEENKESDEQSPKLQVEDEDSGGLEVEKEVVKSFVSLPAEAQEHSLNVEQAVSKSMKPDAAIVIEVAYNEAVEDKNSQSPEEKDGNSSIANPDHVGINEPVSDENTKTAPTVKDVVPEGLRDKLLPSPSRHTPDEKPKEIGQKENGDRDSPPKEEVASTGETSAIFSEEAVLVNNGDTVLNQLIDVPSVGVGSSDGSERSENSPARSLTQRTLRPTSWRSCCGLLQVLRQSHR